MNPAATGFPVLTRENLNEVAMGSYSPKLADSYARELKRKEVVVSLHENYNLLRQDFRSLWGSILINDD